MEKCKPVAITWEFGKHFDKRRKDEAASDKEKFQSAIGCLTYAATATRSDISAAVNALPQFMSDPSMDHWTCVKRILRYVKGTLDYVITCSFVELIQKYRQALPEQTETLLFMLSEYCH